jgi:hypothetical protein
VSTLDELNQAVGEAEAELGRLRDVTAWAEVAALKYEREVLRPREEALEMALFTQRRASV